jgi:hypothetical protein
VNQIAAPTKEAFVVFQSLGTKEQINVMIQMDDEKKMLKI